MMRQGLAHIELAYLFGKSEQIRCDCCICISVEL